MSNQPVNFVYDMVDEPSCARAGALEAYGFSESDIAATLVLSIEHIKFAKTTPAYQEMLKKKSIERAETQIDLTEGWDTFEKNSLAKAIQALEWNNDPKFAILAARVANQAKRPVGSRGNATLDPNNAGRVVHLSLNTKFVQRVTVINQGHPGDLPSPINDTIIEQTPQRAPVKKVNMPSPRQVTDLLAPVRPLLDRIKSDAIEAKFKAAGWDMIDK